MALQSFALSKSELDAYQVLVLDKRIDRTLIVTGCAGSGKSVLAIHKAKELKDQGKSFLFVVFTQALGSYMKAGVNQLGLDISSFSTYGKCFSPDKDAMGNIVSWHWAKGNYDYIIVDEAQDFSMSAIDELKKHCKYLYLFGDSAQSLYDSFWFDHNPTLKMRDLERKFDERMDDLILNHRLPESIAKVAQHLNREDDRLVGRCQKRGGNKPKFLKLPDFESQCERAIEIIDNMGLQDVGILCYHRNEVAEIGRIFSSKGKNIDVYLDDKANIKFDSGNPKAMTFKSSKGLQFQTVFMLGCGHGIDSYVKDAYVAMTRSYEDLYILYSGQMSSMFDSVPETYYDKDIAASSARSQRF
jgi:DNA helicase IV